MTNIGDVFTQNIDTRTLAPRAVGYQVLLMSCISVRLSHLSVQFCVIFVHNILLSSNRRALSFYSMSFAQIIE